MHLSSLASGLFRMSHLDTGGCPFDVLESSVASPLPTARFSRKFRIVLLHRSGLVPKVGVREFAGVIMLS